MYCNYKESFIEYSYPDTVSAVTFSITFVTSAIEPCGQAILRFPQHPYSFFVFFKLCCGDRQVPVYEDYQQ